jgi:hypothetical protein
VFTTGIVVGLAVFALVLAGKGIYGIVQSQDRAAAPPRDTPFAREQSVTTGETGTGRRVLVLQHHFFGSTFGCLASHVLRCDSVACLLRST